MSSGAGYPFSINGNTYNAMDFAGFNYTFALPRVFNDLSVVTQQAAADRAAIVAALANNGNLLIPQTQARLDYISTTQVRLVQAGGSFLWINGLNRPVPFSGVNLSNDGLAELTLYYFYAYTNGATMMLEASTVPYAASGSGIRIKNGDPTRTHVGLAYTDTGGIFSHSSPKRWVRSHYNKIQTALNGTYGSGTTTSTAAIDINPATLSCSYVAYSDDPVDFVFIGNTSNNGGSCSTQLGVDGATVGSQQSSSGANMLFPVSPRVVTARPDGLHTLSLRGFVSGGTGTWSGQILGSVG